MRALRASVISCSPCTLSCSCPGCDCCSAQPSKKARLAADTGIVNPGTLTPAAQWLALQLDDIGEFAAAVLLLMAETAAGAASPFARLVAALPPSHHCVMAWTAEELALLHGTAVEADLSDARGFFEERVAPVAARRRDLWPEGAWCACLQQLLQMMTSNRCSALEFCVCHWPCTRRQDKAVSDRSALNTSIQQQAPQAVLRCLFSM